MAKKDQNASAGSVEVVEEALSKTEQYIEDNQRTLMIVVGAIILIVAGFFAFQRFYLKPVEQEAQSQMFGAQRYFEVDSFQLALNGDGNQVGFLSIIDDYGITESANLSKYYAGISYLHLGEYDNAIEYLEDFDGEDLTVAPIAKGATGDAYMEKGQTDKAIEYYLEAAEMVENDFTAPIYLMKAAKAYEISEKYQKALETYQRIKKEYPASNEARQAEKYIVRVKLTAGIE